jgi:hypothetical protein
MWKPAAYIIMDVRVPRPHPAFPPGGEGKEFDAEARDFATSVHETELGLEQHKKTRAGANADAGPTRQALLNRDAAEPDTIEDRLMAKAKLADMIDVLNQRSLGQMTREEQCRALFGG